MNVGAGLPGDSLVQSLSRGLEILELLARAGEGLGLAQVAEGLSVKPPTAHNLLRTLVAHGFVEKTGRPVRYVLGSAIPRLAQLHATRTWAERAEASLRALSRCLPEATLTIAEYAGGEVSLVLRMSPENPGVMEHPRARHMHAYGSASALVFQAFLREEDRDAYRQRYPFWEYGAQLWQTPEALEACLRQTREQGHCVPPSAGAGTFCVAAAVLGQDGTIQATVGASLAARGEEGRRVDCIEGVKETARALSG